MLNGTFTILYIKWEDEFLPIGCLTSDGISEDTEMLPTTTRDNGGWKTSVPTVQSYSITFSGVLINTNFSGGDFTKVSLDRLRVLKRNRTLIEWQRKDTNLTFIDSGFGYITNLSDNANIDEMMTFEGEIMGYGVINSTTGQVFNITDGQGNNLTDGQDNNIVTA